ncbi:MAG: hypothetical protein ACI83I_002364 [Bacteroidia bacterium]
MKRFVTILLLFTFAVGVSAQSLFKATSDTDNIGEILASANTGEGMYIVHANQDNEYAISYLQEELTRNLGLIPNMPLHGTNPDGEFAVNDALWLNNKLYVLGSYYINTNGKQSNVLFEYNGSTWNDVSDNDIKESGTLVKLLNHNGDLAVVGIFNNSTSNVRLLDNSTWTSLGGWATRNLNKDFITDALALNGQIYLSGMFTKKVGFGQYTSSTLVNGEWVSVNNPPFLYGSSFFASAGNTVILVGQPNSNSDYIKQFVGSGWDDISGGLENVKINKYYDVLSYQNNVYIAGDFEDNNTGRKFNLIYGNKDNWTLSTWAYTANAFNFGIGGESLYVIGDLSSFNLKSIAKLSYLGATITGNIYQDQNFNCNFDINELGVPHQALILNPGKIVMFTDADGYYQIPVQTGSYIITPLLPSKFETKCGFNRSVTIDENKNYHLADLAVSLAPDVVDFEVKGFLRNGYTLVPGAYNEVIIEATNVGTIDLRNAQIVVEMPDVWSSVNFTRAADLVEGNKFTWKLASLKIDEREQIRIYGTLKSDFEESAYILTYKGLLSNLQQDVSDDNNQETMKLNKGSDLPPVSKQCSSGKFFSEASPLSYHIRFVNTGTGEVDRIVVRDTFDADLYIDPIKGASWYTYPSHKSTLTIPPLVPTADGKYRYVFIWTFTDANLLDSSAGIDRCVGFTNVTFNLEKNRHPKGTELCNTAQVFFDNGEPMYTNEICTESALIGLEPEINADFIRIYPNPTSGSFVVENADQIAHQVVVYDQLGKLINRYEVNAFDKLSIHSANWAKGIYFIKVDGFKGHKLVLQ